MEWTRVHLLVNQNILSLRLQLDARLLWEDTFIERKQDWQAWQRQCGGGYRYPLTLTRAGTSEQSSSAEREGCCLVRVRSTLSFLRSRNVNHLTLKRKASVSEAIELHRLNIPVGDFHSCEGPIRRVEWFLHMFLLCWIEEWRSLESHTERQTLSVGW